MPIKIAINGYGRIGRNILRAIYENNMQDEIKVIAINNLGDRSLNAHLTTYDTTHGKFNYPVALTNTGLMVDQDEILVLGDRDPSKLPWADLAIDVVLECTGQFASQAKAAKHLNAGAKKVLISAPAGTEVDATIVYGVNHHILKQQDSIVSNASCTTNCLAPLVKPLHEHLGVESGLMTTVHAYTNDQVLVDVYHQDLRRARSATQSMIPTKTGAASAVGLVLPELEGKLDGLAIRVPTLNVSVVDLSLNVSRDTSVQEVNKILADAASGYVNNVAAINTLPLVSIDFNHNIYSSVFDLTQTKVINKLVKVLAWYDNEWAFSNRMLDTLKAMVHA